MVDEFGMESLLRFLFLLAKCLDHTVRSLHDIGQIKIYRERKNTAINNHNIRLDAQC